MFWVLKVESSALRSPKPSPKRVKVVWRFGSGKNVAMTLARPGLTRAGGRSRPRARWQPAATGCPPRIARVSLPTRAPSSLPGLPAPRWCKHHESAGAMGRGARAALRAAAAFILMSYTSSGKAARLGGGRVMRFQHAVCRHRLASTCLARWAGCGLGLPLATEAGWEAVGTRPRRRAAHSARAGEATGAPLTSFRWVGCRLAGGRGGSRPEAALRPTGWAARCPVLAALYAPLP